MGSATSAGVGTCSCPLLPKKSSIRLRFSYLFVYSPSPQMTDYSCVHGCSIMHNVLNCPGGRRAPLTNALQAEGANMLCM